MTPSPEERAELIEARIQFLLRSKLYSPKGEFTDLIMTALKAYGDERVEEAADVADCYAIREDSKEYRKKEAENQSVRIVTARFIATAIRALKSQPSDKSNE